eukprot:gene8172-16795_t
MKIGGIFLHVVMLLIDSTSTSLRINRIQILIKNVKNRIISFGSFNPTNLFRPLSDPENIMNFIGNVSSFIESPNTKFLDISAGAASLSSPEGVQVEIVPIPKPPQVRAQLLAKNIVKRIPDPILIGLIVLMSSELLQREVLSKTSVLPPLIKDLANTTITELEIKLELLSFYNWDLDPFLRAELDTLQNLPFEAVDKFIVTDILPKIDKEFSPYLARLIGNPEQVSAVTRNIKDLVELTIMVLINKEKPEMNDIRRTTTTLLEQVDFVGAGIEGVVRDWNRIIEDVGKLLKAGSISEIYSSLIKRQSNKHKSNNRQNGSKQTSWDLSWTLPTLSKLQLNVNNSTSNIATIVENEKKSIINIKERLDAVNQ